MTNVWQYNPSWIHSVPGMKKHFRILSRSGMLFLPDSKWARWESLISFTDWLSLLWIWMFELKCVFTLTEQRHLKAKFQLFLYFMVPNKKFCTAMCCFWEKKPYLKIPPGRWLASRIWFVSRWKHSVWSPGHFFKTFQSKKKIRDQSTSWLSAPTCCRSSKVKEKWQNKLNQARMKLLLGYEASGGWKKTVSESTEEWPKGEYLLKAPKY